MTSRPALAAIVLLTVLASGCGSATEATPDPGTTRGSATTAPPVAAATTAPAKAESKGSNVCKDSAGDATVNDIKSVTLKRDGEFLDVTWAMVKRDTGTGTAGFYLNVASEDGNAAGQLGVKYLDGRQIAYFTFRDTNKEISGAAEVTATSVTGSFPMSELEQYGPNFKWGAVTTRDGNDVDACPASDKMRFAG